MLDSKTGGEPHFFDPVIEDDPMLLARYRIITSIPGIGAATGLILLIEMTELCS